MQQGLVCERRRAHLWINADIYKLIQHLETYSLDCKPLSFFLTLSEWSFHQEILIHFKTYSGEIFTKRFNLFLNMLKSW
jgi:hypothetical protein